MDPPRALGMAVLGQKVVYASAAAHCSTAWIAAGAAKQFPQKEVSARARHLVKLYVESYTAFFNMILMIHNDIHIYIYI